VLRKHHVAVDLDIEYSTATLDQRDVRAELLFELVRQTGGAWQVVSHHAVFDRYLHDALLVPDSDKNTSISDSLESRLRVACFDLSESILRINS
jgi:hypothetical protein